MAIVTVFLLVIVAYLLGSIPTGYLLGKSLAGIDIREHGSGSTGATNVLRTIGKKSAIAVLLIDMLKGAIAVLLVKLIYAYSPIELLPTSWQLWLIVTVALVAILGHSKSVWLGFTGGKSVATSLGVLFVMNPLLALGTLGAFGITIAVSRIVSLSSIVGAISLNLLAIFVDGSLPYIIFAALAGGYVIFRHRSNIQRLLAGEEPKIGQTAK
ncbi:glycerol-3-phosphate 1-O-acyltransferase PlsY [Xenococcus sp. PCC 7305]|uniref:glycerol-3-phosphate 1-O-acyltransferase PlsY n=1 Tax=Xenococcus sp. PCC 7305 TaxID=102125 RepID=UPI0005949A57|nr:glycerol-3-phosphate 1-O-acyltransferase PlsY [Xenococcus sp. PCC 7305]